MKPRRWVAGIPYGGPRTRVVEEFEMEQPVPPYLFAFAVGELGSRTRVYAEAVPAVFDSAAGEFAGTEEMIREGERLFGKYEWERFDLLVLPSSFPYGGMENLRLVFLTPTVIKGDASGAQVVAHELAHSWTGNLITNKTNEHFWLNEGQSFFFFVVCEPGTGTQHMESLLKFVYELYTDFVLKNPFYEMETPMRCELFDINLAQAVLKDRVALLGR